MLLRGGHSSSKIHRVRGVRRTPSRVPSTLLRGPDLTLFPEPGTAGTCWALISRLDVDPLCFPSPSLVPCGRGQRETERRPFLWRPWFITRASLIHLQPRFPVRKRKQGFLLSSLPGGVWESK